MAWQNSRNAGALKDGVQARYPGTQVIYTVGDLDHQGSKSDHNPDDDPRYRTDQTDSDSKQEVRGVDIMVTATFSPAQAAALVTYLLTYCRDRLYYVIYDRKIYRRANGFRQETYYGDDPHTNHIHVSTLAAQDENASSWFQTEEDMAITDDDADLIISRLMAFQINSSGFPGGSMNFMNCQKHAWTAAVQAQQNAATLAQLGTAVNTLTDDEQDVVAAIDAARQQSADLAVAEAARDAAESAAIANIPQATIDLLAEQPPATVLETLEDAMTPEAFAALIAEAKNR